MIRIIRILKFIYITFCFVHNVLISNTYMLVHIQHVSAILHVVWHMFYQGCVLLGASTQPPAQVTTIRVTNNSPREMTLLIANVGVQNILAKIWSRTLGESHIASWNHSDCPLYSRETKGWGHMKAYLRQTDPQNQTFRYSSSSDRFGRRYPLYLSEFRQYILLYLRANPFHACDCCDRFVYNWSSFSCEFVVLVGIAPIILYTVSIIMPYCICLLIFKQKGNI